MAFVPKLLLSTVFSALLLAAPARAGDLCFEGGDLGGSVSFELTGTAGELYVFVPSLTEGPLPLGLFFPGVPDVMTVGLDLFNSGFSRIGFFLGLPVSEVFPLPAVPALNGAPLYGQFLTLDALGNFSTLSCRVDVPLMVPQDSAFPFGNVGTARQGQTVNRLDDGSAVVIGGDEPDGGGGLVQALDTIELFDDKTSTFSTLAGALNVRRSTHTATTLDDGRILILGGYADPADGIATTSGEIFDPSTGTTTSIAPMNSPRTQHTATLLDDGRVFVCAGVGRFDLTSVIASLSTGNRDTEVYDPVTDTWTAGPNLPEERLGHQASLLPNGDVLITAGVEVISIFGIPTPFFTSKCHRYDPDTNSFVGGTPSLPGTTRFAFHAQATLSNGRAAVVGGANGDLVTFSFVVLDDAYSYDVNTNSWTVVGSANFPRVYGQLLETSDNRVIIIGGLNAADIFTGSGTPEMRIEESTPSLLSWTHVPTMTMLKAREVSRSVFVGNGGVQRILTVGVGDVTSPPAEKTAEYYCP